MFYFCPLSQLLDYIKASNYWIISPIFSFHHRFFFLFFFVLDHLFTLISSSWYLFAMFSSSVLLSGQITLLLPGEKEQEGSLVREKTWRQRVGALSSQQQLQQAQRPFWIQVNSHHTLRPRTLRCLFHRWKYWLALLSKKKKNTYIFKLIFLDDERECIFPILRLLCQTIKRSNTFFFLVRGLRSFGHVP